MNPGARLGVYALDGEYNRHPVYHVRQHGRDSYLFYVMEGDLL
jgi:hypothetical protein